MFFRTAVDRDNDGVVVNAFYRHSRIKTYLKDGRALRVDTVIDNAYDIGVLRRLEHFGELTAKARDINHRDAAHHACRPGLRPCEPSH